MLKLLRSALDSISSIVSDTHATKPAWRNIRLTQFKKAQHIGQHYSIAQNNSCNTWLIAFVIFKHKMLEYTSLLNCYYAYRMKSPDTINPIKHAYYRIPLIHLFIFLTQYIDVIMSAMASQITSLAIVYSNVYSGADRREHQSSASLAFVRRIHQWPVNSPHKWPVTRKMFPFGDVINVCLLALAQMKPSGMV